MNIKIKNNISISAFLFLFSGILPAQDFVLNQESTFNPKHENKFSFMLGINPSITKSGDISNFTFSYSKQMDNFWLDSNFMITNGIFNKLSANNSAATKATDSDLEGQKSSLTTVGIGIGRETRYAQSLLPFSDIYEFIAANLTYNMYKEDLSGKSFNGPGLLAKFSVYKKFNGYFSAGAHFNYNLAVVKRAQEIDTETNSQRSLALGFLTIGFDLSFYL